MPFKKRAYNNKKRKIAKKYKAPVKKIDASATTIQRAFKKYLFKHAETKNSQSDISDYQEIQHNSFINIFPNNLLNTTPGVNDPTTGNTQNRIGDQISLIKCKIRMMLELNERYSDVTYRIMIIKSSRGDTPTINTLFKGLSGNKMLDEVNYEKYTVIYQKWGKIKAPNVSMGRQAAQDATLTVPSTGIYYNSGTIEGNFLSRATRIIKIDIPGYKFAKDGIIKYEGPTNGQLQKFFDYNVFVYAYSNYNTLAPTGVTSGYNVMAVNDAYVQLAYKDM